MTMISRIVLIVVAVSACVTGISGADMLTPKMVAEDAGLSKSVNLASLRIHVPDLLKEVSKQTGVDISADEDDGASDQQVAARLKEMPVSEVMNGIWSLFSYKGGLWHWERRGVPGKFSYVLTRPPGARRMAERLRNQVQEMFEEQTDGLIRFAKMEPAERLRHRKELADVLLFTDERKAEGFLKDARLWSGLRLFADAVPEGIRKQVYRGEIRQKSTVGTLSASSREFVKSESELADPKRLTGGSVQTAIRESVISYVSSSPSMVAQCLVVSIEGLGGYGYSGGAPLEAALKERMRRMWMREGESAECPLAVQKIPFEAVQVSAPQKRPAGTRIDQTAKPMEISYLARLSLKQIDPGIPSGQVDDYLKERVGVFSKWRKNLLLIDYPRWFHEEPMIAPWRITRAIRDAADKDGGLVPTRELLSVSRKLTKAQLESLAEDYNVFHFVKGFYEVFKAAGASSTTINSLLSKTGIVLSEAEKDYCRKDSALSELFVNDSLSAIRLKESDAIKDRIRTREITFETRIEDGRWIPTIGFKQAAVAK